MTNGPCGANTWISNSLFS